MEVGEEGGSFPSLRVSVKEAASGQARAISSATSEQQSTSCDTGQWLAHGVLQTWAAVRTIEQMET